jgi:small subunit ribosomal protein S1
VNCERKPPTVNETTQTPALSSILDLDNLPSMDSLLQDTDNEQFAPGKIVQGKVVDKRDTSVLVDIGYKAEGLIPREEFADFENVEIGNEIDVYIDILEDDDHETPLLSARKAELMKAWNNLVENYEEGSIIKGTIKRRVKGGLIVDIGVDAFLPGSQVDVGPVKNLEDWLETEHEFKVLKISQERRNVVVSRREIVEESRAEQRGKLLEELEAGQIRKGVVKNITDFGAFIDLNGLDGLLHITDMSWGRISHPSEMLSIGDEIEVMILDVDHEKQRVSLGLKQKEGNPWDEVEAKFPVGSKIKGQVVNIMPYGAFVELEEGIEGLIHVSEMSWTKRITKASDVLSVGDTVEAVVLDIQKEDHKISLGMRQLTDNPWEKLAQDFPRGSKIKGEVRNMTAYGAFVQIQDDIDGMIHVSDMSWTRKVNHPSEVMEKGDVVEAIVLDIDPEQQRISLGLKQLEEDPWSNIESHFNVGDLVQGKVTKVASFGAFVELENGIEGLVHISQLSEEHVKRVKDVINVGDTVSARIVKIDTDERRVGLSLKAADEEDFDATSMSANLKPGEDLVDMGDVFDTAMARIDMDEDQAETEDAAEHSAEQEETKTEETTVEEQEDTEEEKPEEPVKDDQTPETEKKEQEKAEETEADEKEKEKTAE